MALHAFEKNTDIQNAVKTAAVLFLFGIVAFTLAYAGLFIATEDIDRSLHTKDGPTWPEYLWWEPKKTPEQHKKAALRAFAVAVFGGLASFLLFSLGLSAILSMAIELKLG